MTAADKVEPVITVADQARPVEIVSKAGGCPAPAEVSTCPSEPVATATGLPLAS